MKKVIILGAAGRDFHNFNVVFRNNASYSVVAFTATQIPDIANRRYPPELAGPLHPSGIPILEEKDLEDLIGQHAIDVAVFSYSDVSYPHSCTWRRERLLPVPISGSWAPSTLRSRPRCL